MITEAVYAFLLAQSVLTTQVEQRIYPVAFRQAEGFPALCYNLSGVQPLGVRVSDGLLTGTIEVAALTNNTLELETLYATLLSLDNASGNQAGYALSIQLSDAESDFAQQVEDLAAYHRAVTFTFFATKLH